MGLGDYPNFIAPNERHLYHVPRKDPVMAELEKPTQFMVDMPNLEIAFDATDIARLKRSQIIDLITQVDDEVGDWTLTLLLHHHFKREAARALDAVPQQVSMSEDELWDELEREEDESESADEGCQGHPAGPNDPMGQTVTCDGSCREAA
jgi:hypothetical protein